MELKLLNPHKALNKAHRKLKTNRPDINRFKENLIQLLDSINKSGLEKEMCKLVYALYGLTEEEVKIVEGA